MLDVCEKLRLFFIKHFGLVTVPPNKNQVQYVEHKAIFEWQKYL